jgi:hypothetical protein
MAEDKKPGFKVSDRRMFNPDGTPRQPSEEQAPAADSRPQAPPGARTDVEGNVVSFPSTAEGPAEAQDSQDRDSVVSFSGFINMLALESAIHLGLMENPNEGRPTVDLESARHMIDTLVMLQDKTRGNLTSEEANLIETVVSELQMQFVVQSRGR